MSSDLALLPGGAGEALPVALHAVADLELFTRSEVAALLKIKTTWLRDNQALLNLPHVKLGGQVRYSREDIRMIQQLGRLEAVAPTVPTGVAQAPQLTPLARRRH